MATQTGAEPRLLAARAVEAVLSHGRALDEALSQGLQDLNEPRDRALARRLSHQVMRDWPRLEALINACLRRPPAKRDHWVLSLLAVAIAELSEQREPDHAVVHASVEACRLGGAAHLAGLCNAVLRRVQREGPTLNQGLPNTPVLQWGYPEWWVQRMQADWPERWRDILAAGNQAPALTLRVNRRRCSVAQMMEALAALGVEAQAVPHLPDALQLSQRLAIRDLPGWEEGWVSVQDGSAQRVVECLALSDGLQVLDACAAPGGKTAHMLERAEVSVTALDVDAQRLQEVQHNLDRLRLQARLLCADAREPSEWWEGQCYDRILLDAPCSASGVIRRHPDIRWLRRPQDLPKLVATQTQLLDALWPLLKPGGILVYATCSVLAQENHEHKHAFLQRHADAKWVSEQQWLPGEGGMDGFYTLVFERLPGLA